MKPGFGHIQNIFSQAGRSYWTPQTLVVEDAEPTHVVMTGSAVNTTAVAGDFTVNGITATMNSISRDATNMIITGVLSVEVAYGDVLNVVYKEKSYSVTNNVTYWIPQNILITPISGGVRITYTPHVGTETEIYVSIDGGAYSLITTTGLTIGTYDYTCDTGIHTFLFKLRSKLDQTVLNAPSSLAYVDNEDGTVTLTWDDNNTEAEHIELWADIASAGFALLTTVATGVQTYLHTITPGTHVIYEVRAKEGTLPVYSDYSSTVELTTYLPPAPTSYSNTGGSGNRTGVVTVTTNQAIYDGLITQLVEGATTYAGIYVATGGVVGKYYNFDFGAGARKVIDEFKFYQSYGTGAMGTWKCQYSDDESSTPTNFTDIGASFTLNQGTITVLAGNTTGHRHYRIIGISGNFIAVYLCEFEFKIKDAV